MGNEESNIKRFEANDIKVLLRPQCSNCDNNINGLQCEVYNPIPEKFMSNVVKCVYRIIKRLG